MLRKTLLRLLAVAVTVVVVLSPFLLFRENGKYTAFVLAVWLLLAAAYVFARKKD
ncbi:MAG: hypothetical protein RB296_04095 [Acidobacteriota bacterium]|jgi:hypothetical protein|nr:hypothetical protein [Acidobacteriota bacterium]